MDNKSAAILLIDDDADVLRSLGLLLRSRGYARVDYASTPEKGLEMMAATPYDLVLLDMIMPRLNGWAVLERMRTLGIATRVIVVSAVGLADAVREELTAKYHKVDFVSKTQILDELDDRIFEALSRPAETV